MCQSAGDLSPPTREEVKSANSHVSDYGGGFSSSNEALRWVQPHPTAILKETLSMNHLAKLLPDSWPLEIVWDTHGLSCQMWGKPIHVERIVLMFNTFFFFFFFLFRAAPVAHSIWSFPGYGSNQIGATAASLHYSHSNMRSEPYLQPTPELMATSDGQPTEEARD